MSDLHLNSEYGIVLNRCLQAFDPDLLPGVTILYVWRDRLHFEQWKNCEDISKRDEYDIRIEALATSVLMRSGMHLPPECPGNKVSVFGVAFSKQWDLSDLSMRYYLVFLLDPTITNVTMPDDSTLSVNFAVLAPKK